MSGRRAFFTVVVALLVIALVGAAGVALYRLGYARGLAAAGTLPAAGPFMHPYAFGMPGFDDGRLQGWRHGGDMFFGGHRPFGMFGFGGWIVCLLVLAGIAALVVAAVNALTRKHPAEVQVVAAPVVPPAPEPVAAKPARGTGRARASKR
jgi:hypothetical protein